MDIPKDFYDSQTGEPFRHCKICEQNLLDSGEAYAIEKIIKNYPQLDRSEVLFEYAICRNCMQKLQQQLSAASQETISRYFSVKMAQAVPTYGQLDRCIISGKPSQSMSHYQIVALARGNQLAEAAPFAISEEVLQELGELLSAETRDELDRFKDTHFGWPPELSKALGDADLILL